MIAGEPTPERTPIGVVDLTPVEGPPFRRRHRRPRSLPVQWSQPSRASLEGSSLEFDELAVINEAGKLLAEGLLTAPVRGLFHVVWQAWGWPRSPYYDEQGNRAPIVRRRCPSWRNRGEVSFRLRGSSGGRPSQPSTRPIDRGRGASRYQPALSSRQQHRRAKGLTP